MEGIVTDKGVEPIEQVKPIESDVEVTEEHFKSSLIALDNLALVFEELGTKLANSKKKANLRILAAILFETQETEKTFGMREKKMLDICRAIMYHRQIVEIFMMKEELKSQKIIEEMENGR